MQVAVQRVVWNEGGGVEGAPFLASATASGLCRIDWLLGRMLEDRVPYRGVEVARMDVDVNVADESDESN